MTNNVPNLLGYRMPAEWEPHAATWLSWPHDPDTFPEPRLARVEATFTQMIAALAPHETVHVLVNDAAMEERVRGMVDARTVLHRIPTADVWIRDYGPIFIKKEAGSGLVGPERAIVDWIFNVWGHKWPYPSHFDDNGIPKKVADLVRLPVFSPGIVLEGGSIDVNGKGTVLTTEQCLLNPNRNPHLKRREIEQYLFGYLGVSQVVWLGQGIAGDDTDGHVDDCARFVDATTVVCAVEDDVADENYRVLKENVAWLEKAVDQQGRRLTVVPLPMPGNIVADGRRLPVSYTNFYIGNGVVLVPIFGQPNDEKALRIFEKLFPEHSIFGLECTDLVYGYGGIHCASQQEPR